MRRRKRNENSGYSLVELIIVLAIIAILAGMATVTISAIRTARATSSKESFNQELSTLQTMTKTQSKDFAIQLKKSGDEYVITYGTSSNGTNFNEGAAIGTDSSGATVTKDSVTLDRVTIYYSADGSSLGDVVSSAKIIKFNKSDGSVVTGEGVYTFCKEGSKDSVGKVTLNKATGSHYTGS